MFSLILFNFAHSVYGILKAQRIENGWNWLKQSRVYRYWTFEKREKSSEMNATLTRPDSLLPDRLGEMVWKMAGVSSFQKIVGTSHNHPPGLCSARPACACSPIYRERKAESEFLYWIGSLQLKSFKTWLWSALENVMFFWMSGLVVHCRIRRWRFFQVLGNDSSNFICFQELWSSLGHPQKNGNEIILGFAQYYARRYLDISQFPNLRLVAKETEVQVWTICSCP